MRTKGLDYCFSVHKSLATEGSPQEFSGKYDPVRSVSGPELQNLESFWDLQGVPWVTWPPVSQLLSEAWEVVVCWLVYVSLT